MSNAFYTFIESILFILGKSYKAVYWLIKVSCSFSPNIWHRNSVYFGNQIFFYSDIDLTIIKKKHSSLLKRVQILKKLFLMIGEVNVYKESYAPYLSEFINTCELDRDPLLKKRFNIEKSVSKEEAIVFLLRCYHSDLNNLKNHSWLRVRKWKSHLSYLQKNFPELENLNTFETIEALSGQAIKEKDINLKNKVIFPHLWMTSHYSKSDLLELGKESLKCDPIIKKVFLEQLKWEFCGVISQIEVIQNNKQVKAHFINMTTILSCLNDKEAKSLMRGITSFCSDEL